MGMSVWDVLRALSRRWWSVLLGLALTTVVVFQVWTAPGVYHQQVNVLFLMPTEAQRSNGFTSMTENLINLAGVVERVVNDEHAGAQTVSNGVELQDEGVREGFAVRLPNAGGQWMNNFNRPLLNVQAVGPTPEAVKQTMRLVLARVNAALEQLQVDAGVKPELRARTQMNPIDPPIDYSEGNRPRAAMMTVILGVGLTVGLTVLLDEALTAIGNRRRDVDPDAEDDRPDPDRRGRTGRTGRAKDRAAV
jgi:hypothetical protein